MPTPPKGPRLGGSPAHERLMLANLATALFEHGRITTTVTKAKRLRPYAEHLVTFGKRGDLHARRQVAKVIRDKTVIHTLFAEIGPRYENRPGGYTRITKIGPRKGDNAPMAVIELVEALTVAQTAVGEAERARGTRFTSGRGSAARSQAQGGVGTTASTSTGPVDVPAEGAGETTDTEPSPTPQVAVPTEGGDTEVVTESAAAESAVPTDETAEAAGAQPDSSEPDSADHDAVGEMTTGADDSPAGGGSQAAEASETSQAEGDRQ